MHALPKLVALFAALSLGVFPAPRAHAAAADSDPKAVTIAEQVLESLGGRERWAALTGLRWTNDSYWFLMPYRMLDPGVHLQYDAHVSDSHGTFDRIAMVADQGGLWFATAHRQGAAAIMTNNIETLASFPATEFQAP